MAQDDPNPDSGQVTDDGGGERAEHSSQTSQKDDPASQEEAKIPLYRLNQVLDQNKVLTGQMQDLEQKLEKASAPKKYTRAELSEAVEREELTQDKADSIMDVQLREEVISEVTQNVADDAKDARFGAVLKEFEVAIPDLLDETSSTHVRVKQQYVHLVHELGFPNTPGTQIAAIEHVVGSLSSLKKRSTSKSGFEPYPESPGGEGPKDDIHPKDVVWDDLSKDNQEYYAQAIKSGGYPDQKAVLTELNWKRQT